MWFQIIPIVASLWLAIKCIVEIYQTHKDYFNEKYVEDSILHTNQHLGVMYGLVCYSLGIVFNIIVFNAVFSPEWIGILCFVDLILLYVVEHFADERVGVVKPTRTRDIFSIRKRKNKEEHLKGYHEGN